MRPEQQSKLLNLINETFNAEEFKSLCFELPGVEYDNLQGEVKLYKIQSMIEHMLARQRMDELLDKLTEVRQTRDWAQFRSGAVQGENPYRGLQAFQPEHARYYFGREAFVTQLRKAVANHRFIPVLGSSGSGKSSIVFAGLLPPMIDEPSWCIVTLRPGKDAVGNLARSLLFHYEEAATKTVLNDAADVLSRRLEDGSWSLSKIAAWIQEKTPAYQHLLLVVNQFEELYTLNEQPAQEKFLDALIALVQNKDASLIPHIVITLRADFLGQALGYVPFGDLINTYKRATVLLRPLNATELKRIIEEPAKVAGVQLADGLVTHILKDVKEEPGNLPLLQFALTKLWERQHQGELTYAAYENLGGVGGALTHYADEVLGEFNKTEKEQIRHIFLQLVSPGDGREDTRRLATRKELFNVDWGLVSRLASKRLVVTNWENSDQEISDVSGVDIIETVEIIHEVLIQRWQQLREWLEADREFRIWQDGLRLRLQEWQTAERDDGLLLRGVALVTAEERLREYRNLLPDEEKAYIQASVAEKQRIEAETEKNRQQEQDLRAQRRIGLILIWATGIVGILLIVAVILAFQSNSNANLAATREIEASTSEAGAKIAQETSDANAAAAIIARQTSEANANDAIIARGTSDANAAIAGTREVEASVAQATAEYSADELAFLSNSIQASQLALAAEEELNRDHELALLLASTGLALQKQFNTQNTMLYALNTPYRLSLQGHMDIIYSVVFSLDGSQIITASQDGTARVWTAEGEEVAVLEHDDWVTSAMFSPDGSQILTVSVDNIVRVWTAEGEEVALLEHDNFVNSAVFSPDGSQIVTGTSGGTAWVWTAEGEEVAILGGHEFLVEAVFSPDGSQIVTAGFDSTVRVWTAAGEEVAVLEHDDSLVNSAMFSPDGSQIVTEGSEAAWVWTTAGEEVAMLKHDDSVTSVAFSPDGSQIVTASKDGTSRVWTIAGESTAVLRHENGVNSAVFSPDGSRVVTASEDGTARVWTTTGLEVAVLGHEGEVWSAKYSPDGSQILTLSANSSKVRIWDASGEEIIVLKHRSSTFLAAFSPDGEQIVTASGDGAAWIWTAAGEEVAILGHEDLVLSVAFSPDGSQIVTASGDGTARVWTAAGELVAVLRHESGVNSAVFSPDGSQIVTASADSAAVVWTLAEGPVAVLRGHERGVNSAVFSPDGSHIVTASDDKTVRVWTTEGEEVFVLEGHEGQVWSAQYSPDGAQILTADRDSTVRVWTAAGQAVVVLRHEGRIYSVMYSPDGEHIVTAAEGGPARVWTAAGEEVALLGGHDSGINSVVFSPDGSRIVTASEDGTARVWTVAGEPVALLQGHEGRIYSVNYSPDGKQIVTGSGDFTARVWPAPLSLAEALGIAAERLARGFADAECNRYFSDDLALCPRSKEDLLALFDQAVMRQSE